MIVGEASNLPSGEAFGGRSGRFLASLLGVGLPEFMATFDRVNLLSTWPGRSGGRKGHLFPLGEARRAALVMDLRGRHVVLAGRRVASAFGIGKAAFLEPAEAGKGEASCVVVPHPSGIVRWYNLPANREAVGLVLRKAVEACAVSSGRRG